MAKTTTYQTPNTNIYKYTATMKYILGSDVINIDTENIKSIAIDSDYLNLNMPMVFVTLGLYKSTINKMILNQDTGVFILDIKRCITNSDMPDLYTDYINDTFIYFISGSIDEAITNNVDEDDANNSDAVSTISLGLLSLDHINKNKKSINIDGVLNGSLSSIMYYITKDLKILIEPPKNNTNMNIILPPINSISKMISYLNSISVFYPTPYRFFIDFDKSYLISSSGNPIRCIGEDMSTIMMTVYNEKMMINLHHNDSSQESMIQGLFIDKEKSMYRMNVALTDCDISDSHSTEKSFSKLSAMDTSGNKVQYSLPSISPETSIKKSRTRSIRVLNDNTGIVNNIITNIDASTIILIQKVNIDSSIFTINKEYIIKADEAYKTEIYNGRYILIRKRELYIREDDNFTMNVMLMFRKV